jgi:hypothetical protein
LASSYDLQLDRELGEQLRQWETAILRGDATDWANYMYLCGQIYGIRFAMQVLADTRLKIAADQGEFA